MSNSELRINRELDFDAVNWPHVLDALVNSLSMPFVKAESLIRKFRHSFLRPLNMYWYLSSQVSREENLLLLAVCETLGSDSVTLKHEKSIRSGPFTIQYAQKILFEPELRKSAHS